MSILAECPICHDKQSAKNKLCKCGADLDKAKKGKKVRYWIIYRLPGGKQKKEAVGNMEGLDPYSIEDARDAESKRKVEKKEKRKPVFEIKPEFKTTFNDLSDWYLKSEKVKSLKSYLQITISLKKFNKEFGPMMVGDIKLENLEDLQVKSKKGGLADATIDHVIKAASAMINKAFDNDKVGGETLKVFKKVKKLLKRNANARKMVLTLDQFTKLMQNLPFHTRCVTATAFYTGMRKGEIVNLTWDKVSLPNRTIQLEAIDTKTKSPRLIPIADGLYAILKSIPKSIHDKSIHRNHVFLFQGKPFKTIRDSLAPACEKAGIPYGRFVKDGFVYHDLRHTFNTYMRKAGISDSVTMDITGHATREMFDRYNTTDQDDLQQGMKRFEGYLQEQSVRGEKVAAEAGKNP